MRLAPLALLLIAMGNSPLARSQGGSGAIEGRISDTQQLALPAATIEIRDSQGKTIKKIVERYSSVAQNHRSPWLHRGDK